VLFGAPVPMPAAEQARACLDMATTMYQRLDQLNREWLAAGVLRAPLACRMGVHSGEAVVGSFGSDRRSDYTAIGSVVNLASRLESSCTPGAIAVSPATWALLTEADRAALAAATSRTATVKGFADPVEFHELAGRGHHHRRSA